MTKKRHLLNAADFYISTIRDFGKELGLDRDLIYDTSIVNLIALCTSIIKGRKVISKKYNQLNKDLRELIRKSKNDKIDIAPDTLKEILDKVKYD